MMDVEQRARELLAQAFGCEREELLPVEVRAVRAVLAYHAALTPPEGHIVVTRNEAGQAVAVTRQDDEGRILSVIAEFEPPTGYVLVPVEPTETMVRAGLNAPFRGHPETCGPSLPDMWTAMLAARPEVKP